MNIDIVPIVNQYLSKNEIVISDSTELDELVYKLTKHMDALIYNTVSVAALVANIEDNEKIEPKHLVAAQAYIAHKCVGNSASKRIIGGSHEITLDDLNQIEPPKIDDEKKYKMCSRLDLRSFVHRILDHHNMRISKGATKGIMKILDEHLECLLNDIKKNEPLTLAKLENIMSMKRYSIFN